MNLDEIKCFCENKLFEKVNLVEEVNKGVTNNSYLVETDENKYIIRIPGKGTNEYINRIDEVINTEKVMHLDILPNIFYANKYTGTIISQYIYNSKELTKEDLYSQNHLSALIDILIKLHSSDIKFNNEFNIEKKLLNIRKFWII